MNIDGLEVQVVRKPIKNMYLRIKPPNGDVVISAPRRMSERTIVDFVRGRRRWIDDHIRDMARARQRSGLNAGDAGDRGQAGAVDSAASVTFSWTDERKHQAAANINAALPTLLAHWGPIIGRQPAHITLRIMTSRWGSCTPKTGRIRLNLQLGLMDPRFLEYVLVHEMTHLWASGHGTEFQRRMSIYLPNWRQLRRELNACVVW
nr:SprT family zinc-dependent metalloprotease [Bifidobacterium goeldii]